MSSKGVSLAGRARMGSPGLRVVHVVLVLRMGSRSLPEREGKRGCALGLVEVSA